MNLASMQNPGAKLNFFSFASQTVKTTGIMGLYDGIGAGIWRQIFYASSRYGLFQVLRDTLAKYREVDFASRLACATAAGGMAALISCPCEVSLVRLSNDATLEPSMRRNYKGVVDCAQRIAQEEGVTAFWRGSTPFVTRACLVGATQEFWFRESREFRDRAMTETAKRRSAYEARDTRDPPRGRSPSREDAEVGYTPRSVRDPFPKDPKDQQVSSPKALTKSSPMPKPIRPTTTGLSAKLVNAETLKAENAALREELARANL
ncbi:unnamed protein product, partial [Cladocopium goreaui]